MRLFSAALGLGSFTKRELASGSGVPLETVRTIMRRREGEFEIVDDDQHAPTPRQGRPAGRQRLVNPEKIAAELAKAVEQFGASVPVYDPPPINDDEEHAAALSLAVANIERIRAHSTREAVFEHLRAARRAVEPTAKSQTAPPDARARAFVLQAITYAIETTYVADGETRREALQRAVHAARIAFEQNRQIGREAVSALFRVSGQLGLDPPIVVLGTDEKKADAAGVFYGNDVSRTAFTDRTLLFTPGYAGELLGAGAIAGVVIKLSPHDDDPSLTGMLASLRDYGWTSPTYVLAPQKDSSSLINTTLRRTTLMGGATWVTKDDAPEIVTFVKSAFENNVEDHLGVLGPPSMKEQPTS